ncbi:MAG: ATP-binding protein [Burkholderiaceae bacterium]
MDGVKARVRRSLQLRLSLWLSVVILAVALAAGAFSFVVAFDEAIELQDDQLRQIGAFVERQPIPVTGPRVGRGGGDGDSERRIIIEPLPRVSAADRSGDEAVGTAPPVWSNGLQTAMVHGQRWRLLVLGADADARFMIGQRTAVRDEIARDSALRTVLPLCVLIPILLLVVGALVRRMFRPIKALASELDRRGDHDLRELPAAELPTEVLPFVVAINRLLVRVAQSIQTQQRFLADAAHELRSPVAALTLQAEGIESAATPLEAAERLATLRGGLQRTRLLLEQLLSLARSQASAIPAQQQVSIRQAVLRVLEEQMPLAEAKEIDLGVQGNLDAVVEVSEVDLVTLVKNLVENAIRYTPAGGRVDLSLNSQPDAPGEVTLRVEDTGPDIAVAERERVFDPFYRVLGSGEAGAGLGLSIVGTIARRIGAPIRLGPSGMEGAAPGLRVSVTFKGQRR